MIKRTPLLIVILGLLLFLTACQSNGMGMKEKFAEIPVGMAYVEGNEIYFMHTETSDEKVGALLSDMMDSPVLAVPALADLPDSALANVYVFENGLEGMGPLGFQADVFDAPPGDAAYSPLRRLNLVKWQNPDQARLLKSVLDVLDLEAAGELTITRPGVVINMPFVTWQGGMR